MKPLLFIAAGGAIGSVLRYLIAGWIQRGTGATFAWGTLGVNVSGCFLIGLLGYLLTEGPLAARPELRMGLLVGVLGGFTTFSTFGWETLELARSGQVRLAVLNIVLSNALGLCGAWLGYRIGGAIHSPGG